MILRSAQSFVFLFSLIFVSEAWAQFAPAAAGRGGPQAMPFNRLINTGGTPIRSVTINPGPPNWNFGFQEYSSGALNMDPINMQPEENFVQTRPFCVDIDNDGREELIMTRRDGFFWDTVIGNLEAAPLTGSILNGVIVQDIRDRDNDGIPELLVDYESNPGFRRKRILEAPQLGVLPTFSDYIWQSPELNQIHVSEARFFPEGDLVAIVIDTDFDTSVGKEIQIWDTYNDIMTSNLPLNFTNGLEIADFDGDGLYELFQASHLLEFYFIEIDANGVMGPDDQGTISGAFQNFNTRVIPDFNGNGLPELAMLSQQDWNNGMNGHRSPVLNIIEKRPNGLGYDILHSESFLDDHPGSYKGITVGDIVRRQVMTHPSQARENQGLAISLESETHLYDIDFVRRRTFTNNNEGPVAFCDFNGNNNKAVVTNYTQSTLAIRPFLN